MPITRSVAKKLCTKAEYEVVEASFDAKKNNMPLLRAKQKVTLSRKLRDKYRDLAHSQRREERGKSSPKRTRPAQGNEGSVKKEQLFSETLARFQKYHDYLEERQKKEELKKKKEKAKKKLSPKKNVSKSVVAKAKKSTARGSVKKKTGISAVQRKLEQAALKKKKNAAKKATTSMSSKSKSAKGNTRDFKMKQNRGVVIHSHVKASGKRNQAKRDSKN